MKQLAATLIRFALQLLGVLFILIGALIFPLPLPVGLLLIALGFTLLTFSSLTFRRFIQARRRHHPRFHQLLEKAEIRLPPSAARILRDTWPDTGGPGSPL